MKNSLMQHCASAFLANLGGLIFKISDTSPPTMVGPPSSLILSAPPFQNSCIRPCLTEKLCFIQFSTRMANWLLLTFFICLHNQLSSIHSTIHYLIIYLYLCLKKVIYQLDSKNELLLLSASFTTKFELVFALTLENDFT